MKNLTWQNPEQLFVAQELINKVKSKCCGIKAYLNSDYELISVDLKSTADVEVSVTSLFTNETILSDSYSTSTSEIILNLAGLLNEGEAYRIEITIGDTVLYGDFTY